MVFSHNQLVNFRRYCFQSYIVFYVCLVLLLCVCPILASDIGQFVTYSVEDGVFHLADSDGVAVLCVDSNDYAGVIRAVGDLRVDVNRVTGSPQL